MTQLIQSRRIGGIGRVRERHRSSSVRQGAMLILMLVMLVILIVMAVFSVDVAYMQLVRTELRTATDAAARAASESLIRNQSSPQARRAAQSTAAQNRVGNRPLILADEDVVFGAAQPTGHGTFSFAAGQSPNNAVQVFGRRTNGSASGSVPLFMGGLLGTGAFEPQLTSVATGFVRDVALVLDRSGSMSGQKIRDLKSAVSDFLTILEGTTSDERVSLTSYSTASTRDVAMTSNLGLVRRQTNNLVANGFTAIGQGLQDGINSLSFDPRSRDFAEKTIILMTDGIENRSPNVESIVPQAESRGYTIHTITFGSGADQGLMRRVASRTGGTHQHANNGADLEEAFREIARTLAVLTIE